MDAPHWVRVGGGFELQPGGERHGPADEAIPPPGGPWQPLHFQRELVGWAPSASPALAASCAAAGERLRLDQRAHLLGRLDHKLRSAVLSLQESARAAAFGRGELLETVYNQAQEVGRRAAGLAAAAIDSKEPARAVVLATALRHSQTAQGGIPRDALVHAPETLLMEVFNRAAEWLGEPSLEATAVRTGRWWRVELDGRPRHLDVPELGEPLLRELVDIQIGGWIDTSAGTRVVLFLPAADG